jgi:hypothetical protein
MQATTVVGTSPALTPLLKVVIAMRRHMRITLAVVLGLLSTQGAFADKIDVALRSAGRTVGVASIVAAGANSTRVTVSLPSANGNRVRIYRGVCTDMGTVAYRLNDMSDGVSVTTLNVNIAKFRPQGERYAPLAINVDLLHSNASVACGDFTGDVTEE